MRRLVYWVMEAMANISLNPTSTVIAVGTTAFALACFGGFLLLYLNLKDMVSTLQEEIQVILYLKDDVSADVRTHLRERLSRDPQVASLDFVSKEQALKDFRSQFPSEVHLLDGLGGNPLPSSLTATFHPQYRTPESVRRWAERQRTLPGIEQVQFSRAWIENLQTVVGYVELTAVVLGTLLAAATVTIIAGIIRLTLYARRDEIEVMRMVGATGAFIKVPYMVEGAVLGAVGGALSVGLLRGSFEFFQAQMGTSGVFLGAGTAFRFLPVHTWGFLIGGGLLLGAAGSFVSLLDLGRSKA